MNKIALAFPGFMHVFDEDDDGKAVAGTGSTVIPMNCQACGNKWELTYPHSVGFPLNGKECPRCGNE